jgi:Spy/CpxP family protein refolding chaperone
MGGGDMAAVAAGHAAELKATLKITPAQESAWKAYETAMQQQATAMQAMRSQMQALMQKQQPGGDSADFIAQRDAMIKQHDASRAAHTAAFKELYAVLTPEQRAIADRGVGAMGGYRMGGWHMR